MDSIDGDMGVESVKLIIDIDEATYEYAKNNKSYLPLFYCEEVWRALSEGTPIPDNAKQDEAISTLKNTAWLGTEEDRAKVDEAISALERQAEPQGEWIPLTVKIVAGLYGTRTTAGYKCSKCQGVKEIRSHFCPDCGAKMIESEELNNE